MVRLSDGHAADPHNGIDLVLPSVEGIITKEILSTREITMKHTL